MQCSPARDRRRAGRRGRVLARRARPRPGRRTTGRRRHRATATSAPCPRDLVMMCGVFGNITDDDIRARCGHCRRCCAPGATVDLDPRAIHLGRPGADDRHLARRGRLRRGGDGRAGRHHLPRRGPSARRERLETSAPGTGLFTIRPMTRPGHGQIGAPCLYGGRVSLRLRLIGLFLVLVAVVAGSALATSVALRQRGGRANRVANLWQPASVQSRSLLTYLVNQETGQRGYVLTGDEAFLEPYRNGGARVPSHARPMKSVRGRPGDDQGARRRAAWLPTGGTGTRPCPRSPRGGKAGSTPPDSSSSRRQGKTLFDDVRTEVTALQRQIDARAARAAEPRGQDIDALRTRRAHRSDSHRRCRAARCAARAGLGARAGRTAPAAHEGGGGRTHRPEVLVTGPPEVVAIAQDAENMRRRIVSELEATREATEALYQHSPVVVGAAT